MECKRHEQGDIWKGRETTGEKYLPAWHTAICPASSLEGQSWHLLLTLKCFHNLETCIFSWRTILKQRSCWPAEEDKMYLCLSLATAESTQLGPCSFHPLLSSEHGVRSMQVCFSVRRGCTCILSVCMYLEYTATCNLQSAFLQPCFSYMVNILW